MPYLYGNRMQYNVLYNGNMVKAQDTNMSHFFQRYLWQDLIGVIKWELPDNWSYDYFTYTLYLNGYIAIINTDKFGIIPQACSPMGYNVFYEPTQVIISNPLLRGIIQPYIGRQCSIIRITPDWFGMEDIVTYYADLMATACSAIGVNLINSKLAYVLLGSSAAAAKTLKGIYSQIASGEPAVVVDEDCISHDGSPAWELFDNHLATNYITDKLLVDLEKIRNQFRTHVGIPNSNTEKKERQIVDEVNSNNTATKMLTDTMLERIRRGIKQTESVFGGNVRIKADWRYDMDETAFGKPDVGTESKAGRSGKDASS